MDAVEILWSDRTKPCGARRKDGLVTCCQSTHYIVDGKRRCVSHLKSLYNRHLQVPLAVVAAFKTLRRAA